MRRGFSRSLGERAPKHEVGVEFFNRPKVARGTISGINQCLGFKVRSQRNVLKCS